MNNLKYDVEQKYYAIIYVQFETYKTIFVIGYGYIPIKKYGNTHRHDK